MGNGNSSLGEVYKLHEFLHEAMGLLAGVQQPRMSTDTSIDSDVLDAENRITDIAKYIYFKLTGIKL